MTNLKRTLTRLALSLTLVALVVAPARPARAAAYVVSNTNDSGAGSLRQAIIDALASPEDDTITFSVSGTINLATTLPNLDQGGALTIDGTGQNITISGPGAGCTTNPNCGVFRSQITLTLINLTVTNGYVNAEGGGIFNVESTLNVTNCTVSGNHSGNGGTIFTLEDGFTTITNSTVSDNYGGGIGFAGSSDPTVTVINSTVSNNDGAGIGGNGNIAVIHSTIVSNTTGVHNSNFFGGSFTLTNTIVASNTTNCMVMMDPFTDGGYNLVWGDTTNCPGTNADPKLLPLADNGGPTWTYALDNGSAALEQIPPGTNGCGTTYTTDQRGEPRPYGTSCEIGAWEGPPPTAAGLALTKAVSPSSAKPGEAITYTIAFSNTGTITATNVIITDTLSVNISNASYSSSGVILTQVPGSQYVWTAPDLLENDGGIITITGLLVKPLAAGTLPNTVTLAVSGTVKTANADLTVENVAPVAVGIDHSTRISETATLDGSGSFDDNGDALTYGWAQTGGAPTVTLSDPAAQSPTFTAPSTETVLTFTLTVTDTALADTDEVVVTVVENYIYYWPLIFKNYTP
ncbi:MAG: choice-of-anchor Q domain-containing protein [Chloroflexota bacterium]|nr:choice-of-anchor Q domain-containing protein [Chloroflexota bacterium]